MSKNEINVKELEKVNGGSITSDAILARRLMLKKQRILAAELAKAHPELRTPNEYRTKMQLIKEQQAERTALQ